MLRNHTKALKSTLAGAKTLMKRNSQTLPSSRSAFVKNNNFVSTMMMENGQLMNFSSCLKNSGSESSAVAFGEYHQRSQYCGEVSSDELVGKQVKLNGWVENIRIINQNECVF